MQYGPESLLPPVVAIVLAIVTRTVVFPLAAGVFVGAILLSQATPDANWYQAVTIFVFSMWDSVSDKYHLQALAFSLLLGAMVGVLEIGGGMHALIRRLSKRVTTRRGAQTMIAGSGLAIFFDDYANTLLLGGTMRSTADRYGISRAKLAYLVDSTAAPVAGLSVVSTWAAIEISYIADGLNAAGIDDRSAAFEMFIQSIPYRFYPWLALAMVFVIAKSGRDFGAMRKVEESTQPSEPASSDATQDARKSSADQRSWLWAAAVVPVLFCLAGVAATLFVTGRGAIQEQPVTIGTLRLVGEVINHGDAYVALIVGGAIGLISAVAAHFWLGGCNTGTLLLGVVRGAWQMMPAMIILWFAWALSAMTEADALNTSGYLASKLTDQLAAWLLPTVVFVLAGFIAFATGTSWGTMGILTPLSISLALQIDPQGGPEGAICLATCGSVLAGAIFGDHCSPISDTTVLSSRASGCDHLQHVQTQLPYALLVGLVCILVGTLPAALGFSPWWAIILGVAVLALVVRAIGKRPPDRETADVTV